MANEVNSCSSRSGHAAPAVIRLLFCGADKNWESRAADEIRRRHLFFLQAFIADPAISHVHVLQRGSRSSFLRKWWSSRRREECSDLRESTEILVIRWLPERPWLPWTATLNRAFARWLVQRRLNQTAAATVVWCYALRGIALGDYLDLEGDWFVDTDHDIVNDPNRQTLSLEEAEALLLHCARRARCVFSASRNLLRWLGKNGIEHVRRLRNGVLPERFDGLPTSPPGFRFGAQPVLGYVGVLSPWIDFDLLLNLAARRPDWRFVVAGPWYRMRPLAELERAGNIDLIGPVAGLEVPRLLSGFDVALGLYRQKSWLDVDSMKLHEYLAVGLPTVSTPFHAKLGEDFERLVTIAEDAAAFEVEISRILDWPETERQRFRTRCRDFTTRHSWEARTREVLGILKAKIFENGALE